MNTLRIAFLAAATTLTLLSPVTSFAAGSEPAPAAKVEDCKKGEVYDKKTKKCVKQQKSSMNDADLLDNGRALAYAGRFNEAVVVLNKISSANRNTPEVLNYLGYATRNSGDIEGGLAYYRAAIALDPNYTLARSYMGQALLLKGDRRGAQVQLSEIESRVGVEAREYKLLAVAMLKKSLKGNATY